MCFSGVSRINYVRLCSYVPYEYANMYSKWEVQYTKERE